MVVSVVKILVKIGVNLNILKRAFKTSNMVDYCSPEVVRVQRYVRIRSPIETIEEVTYTFTCSKDADYVCFPRVYSGGGVGTYLAREDGGYLLIERVINEDGKAVSILPTRFVEEWFNLKPGEDYICLQMPATPNRLHVTTFTIHRPVSLYPIIVTTWDKVKPYYDADLSDFIIGIEKIPPPHGQRQYFQILFDNEHLEFKLKDLQENLNNLRKGEKIEDLKLGIPGLKEETEPKPRSFVYTFRVSKAEPIDIKYRVTSSSFYKTLAWVIALSSLAILGGVSLFLIVVSLIHPSLIINYSAIALPVITTLAILLLSGYVVIPKESLIKYRVLRWLTIVVIPTLLAALGVMLTKA